MYLTGYTKIPRQTLCSTDGLSEITSETECIAAAAQLGFRLNSPTSFDGPDDFPGCFRDEDTRKTVFFNVSPNPRRTTLNSSYAAICKGNR